MSSEYDTGEIRALARSIGKIAEDVAQVETGQLSAIRRELQGNFVGEAGTALARAVEDLSGDTRSISSALGEIRDALYSLARRVEAADAAAKALIGSR